MKVKIGIIENDVLYLDRLIQSFSNKYAEKIEFFSYTKVDSFLEDYQQKRFDIVLLSSDFTVPEEITNSQMGYGYLVNQNDIDSVNEVVAIGKYQDLDSLYKQIISLYASNDSNVKIKQNASGNNCKTLLVTSASGGVGTSTMALAIAKNLTNRSKKVLYLNLEKNAGAEIHLQPTGRNTFSDIIYLLKSNKSNIALKMEGIVEKSEAGFFYFTPCHNILDMMEFNKACADKLLKELYIICDYDYIVIDTKVELDEMGIGLLDYAEAIYLVTDGTQVSCKKLKRFLDSLVIQESQKGSRYLSKTSMICNRFSNKNSYEAQDVSLPIIGGTPRYDGVSEQQILAEISNLPFLNTIN